MTDLKIEIISDVMCPWCLIGKRRLERALADLPDLAVAVAWRPYQLDASLPAAGLDRQVYLENKFGSRARSIYDNIRQIGLDENIPFDFEAIKFSPNTLDAHRLIHWAETAGCQDQIVDKLFAGYFLGGEDIGERAILVRIAGECGMNEKAVGDLLASDADRDVVRRNIDSARQSGVSGVPTFIVNQKYAITGAQDKDTLVRMLSQLATTAN